MINNITIKNIATFDKDGCEFRDFKKINFLYGANGSGKTTLSKVIANQDYYENCSVAWAGRNELQTLVYNRDFINENFSPDHELKGVFTLGESEKGTVDAIRAAKAVCAGTQKEIEAKNKTLDGKKLELLNLEKEFKNQCWKLKQKYDPYFHKAFTGVLGDKEKFKFKLVTESKQNTATLVSFENLRKQADNLFADDLAKEDQIPPINYSDLIALESSEILTKKVIGKDDVDIAAMIKKLGNSDWVKTGREYFERNDDFCPFCQQKTDADFAASLAEYFDDAYLMDTAAIKTLASSYDSLSDGLLQQIDAILSDKPKFLYCDAIQAKKAVADERVTVNKQGIARKKKEASTSVTLSPLKDVLDEISEAITAANQKAKDRDSLIDNAAKHKRVFSAQLWRFLVGEIEPTLRPYVTKEANLCKAIDSLEEGIRENEELRKAKSIEIQDLEKQITNIQPTIDAINEFLSSSGFSGFLLAKSESEKDGFYKIIRPNGSGAQETLSEGEKTFVTFLYFYHLLKGSTSESGITEDRVVVFDDPVSSLDNDIMFIVSYLIIDVFNQVLQDSGNIKQVFVLTHNVYFHKVISFNRHDSHKKADETFWIIKKHNNCSMAKSYDKNPITTSYELLWSVLRDPHKSGVTVQNAMRRIIEHYFKMVGRRNFKDIANKLKKSEKSIFGHLTLWMNEGSHSTYDDTLYVACDEDTVDKYMQVFKNVFVAAGHEDHYNMMMRQDQA